MHVGRRLAPRLRLRRRRAPRRSPCTRRAGLIDVSTLGKLIVRGPDAGEFLDRLYPNRFSNLKPGRIRYGVIASDAGRIMDDGTVCRLDEDSFYVTTTSSGAGAVYEWFSWWLADWGLDVHLTDVTQGLGAVNLAGPRAREIMGELTELDCSSEAFTYLDGKRAEVAGVPCLILRIGFVGEVGYEIHFPSAHGEHLWDALLRGGRRARPEAVRARAAAAAAPRRRCTSSSARTPTRSRTRSAPRCPGSSSSTRSRTSSASGRSSATRTSRSRPRSSASRCANGHVPTEGAAVMPDGDGPSARSRARATRPSSARVIGMAWVPAALAKEGARVDDLRRRQAARGRGRRRSPSTTRTARCCAREPRVPLARARARSRAARWSARRSPRARRSSSATAGTSPSASTARGRARALPLDGRLRGRLAPGQDRAAGRARASSAAIGRRRGARARPRHPRGRRLVVPVLARSARSPCASRSHPRRCATASRRPAPSAPACQRHRRDHGPRRR